MKFTGESSGRELQVTFTESLLSTSGTLQSSGKSVVGSIVSGSAIPLGYLADKQDQHPAVIYNEYGDGKVILFTFDLLASADKEKVAELLGDAITYFKPELHKVRALGRIPVAIGVVNSTEPIGLRITETVPAGSSADTASPDGEVAGHTITWLQELAPSSSGEFLYYLSLPDVKGEYRAVTQLAFGNQGSYRELESCELRLSVPNSSAEILELVIADLKAIPASGAKDIVILTDAVGTLSMITVDPASRREAEREIESLVKVTELIEGLSTETADLRLNLGELLKILERKWYVSEQ